MPSKYAIRHIEDTAMRAALKIMFRNLAVNVSVTIGRDENFLKCSLLEIIYYSDFMKILSAGEY